jgi:predicted lipid-binding transport protein (Tim44 family)
MSGGAPNLFAAGFCAGMGTSALIDGKLGIAAFNVFLVLVNLLFVAIMRRNEAA